MVNASAIRYVINTPVANQKVSFHGIYGPRFGILLYKILHQQTHNPSCPKASNVLAKAIPAFIVIVDNKCNGYKQN